MARRTTDREMNMIPEPVKAIVEVSETLAAADRAQVRRWEGEGELDPEFGELPLVVRLGHLGSTFAHTVGTCPAAERRAVLAAVEDVVAHGADADQSAMKLGFLEAVQHAQGDEFDLRTIWPEMGPRSREVCLMMDRRHGIES